MSRWERFTFEAWFWLRGWGVTTAGAAAGAAALWACGAPDFGALFAVAVISLAACVRA